MKDNLGLRCHELLPQQFGVTDVDVTRFDIEAQQVPMIRCRFRRQRYGVHSGAQCLQLKYQPAALEAGMSGYQYPSILVDIAEHRYQLFQGALPDDHRDSRWFLSRIVSIACQKPSW